MPDTVNMTAGSKAKSLGGGSVRISNVIDLEVANTTNVAAGGGTLAANDIVQCLSIPKYMHVKNVWVTVKRAYTGSALASHVGTNNSPALTGYDVDGFDAAVALSTAVGTLSYGVGGTDALVTAGGLCFDAASSIDLTLSTVTSVTAWPKVLMVAECFDPSYV